MSFWNGLVLSLILLAGWQVSQASGCFALIVGREASADGSVLVGHNEENGGLRVLNFRRVPRQQFDLPAVVRLRRGGQLAQVAQTWAMLWSENPALEPSDGYLNEWGVIIVSDGCRTREDDYKTLVARGEIRQGGIGYMLRRLVARRAQSAREGVELAGRLVERFGYVDSGRSYVIADPREAWVFGVVRGRRWVARRVPDDGVVALPNVHIIGEVDLDDGKNFLASADLVEYAAKRGWFDPDGGEPFDFRKAYMKAEQLAPDPRRWQAQQLVTGDGGKWPSAKPLPFAVKPAEKLSVASVVTVLRHSEGPGALSHASTQEAAVFQLRSSMPRQIGCIYWRTTARPCGSVLTPWYLGITHTPRQYYRPVDWRLQLTLEHHFDPPPGTFSPDGESAWWKFKTLQDLIAKDYAARTALVRPTWAAFEDRLFDRQKEIEAKALALWQTDQQTARAYLTEYCAKVAAEACDEADRLAETLRGPREKETRAARVPVR